MVKCAHCIYSSAQSKEVFDGTAGALLGPFWLCDLCFSYLMEDLKQTEEDEDGEVHEV